MGEEKVVDRREELDIVAELVDLARQEDDVPRVGCDDSDLVDVAAGDVGQDLVQRQLVDRRGVVGRLRLDDVARRLADVERDRQQFGRPERRGFATAEDPLPVVGAAQVRDMRRKQIVDQLPSRARAATESFDWPKPVSDSASTATGSLLVDVLRRSARKTASVRWTVARKRSRWGAGTLRAQSTDIDRRSSTGDDLELDAAGLDPSRIDPGPKHLLERGLTARESRAEDVIVLDLLVAAVPDVPRAGQAEAFVHAICVQAQRRGLGDEKEEQKIAVAGVLAEKDHAGFRGSGRGETGFRRTFKGSVPWLQLDVESFLERHGRR